MKLSIIIPGIRTKNWLRLYESLYTSYFPFGKEAEIIFVGPYEPPSILDVVNTTKNIKYIKSFRSPNACQQQGLLEATGEYITFASDDGVFLPGALDYALSMAEYKTIVVGKYLEGDNPNPDMLKDDYYRFKYHKGYGIKSDYLIFNCGVISRRFLTELGGWDCIFEATTCAHAELGIRAIRAGAEMVLQDKIMFKCSHQPGKTGDHAPIDRAMQRDLKTFKKLWSKPREKVELENWKNTSIRWAERFGK